MYRVSFSRQGEVDISRLDVSIAERVLKKLWWLSENIETITPERLIGIRPPVFKLRVGDYRALYTSDGEKRVITVHSVRHRREVYKTR